MPLHEEEWEAEDSSFVPVRISEFYSPRKVAFDLSLKLGNGRYLRIFRAGEEFSEAELKAYEADRGIRYVYFDRAHRQVFIKSSAALLKKISTLAAVPLKTKFGMARILSELYIQELFQCSDEDRPALLEQGKSLCALLASWIEIETGLTQYLLNLDQTDPSVESLSFLTGMFASAFSRRFPWKSQRTTETLLLASFVCDLGTAALPADVAKLKPRRMSNAQRKIFEKHPELSYLLLQEAGAVHENVLLIVRQHHEYFDGTGYPHKLTGEKTLMLAKLVCFSGDLIRASSDYLLPPCEAAKMLVPELSKKAFTSHPEQVAKYDKDLLASFFELFAKESVEGAAA